MENTMPACTLLSTFRVPKWLLSASQITFLKVFFFIIEVEDRSLPADALSYTTQTKNEHVVHSYHLQHSTTMGLLWFAMGTLITDADKQTFTQLVSNSYR